MKPAIKALCQALKRLKAQFMLIGGVAVQARGFARTTRDLDATVRGDQVTVPGLKKSLAQSRIVPRVADFEALASENFILLLVHSPSGTPIDLSLAWLDFEQAACARATDEKFGSVFAPVIRLEDLVVMKAIAWRERDQNDLRTLLSLSRSVDLDFVEAQIKSIAEVMDEPDRLAAFRRLASQVRPSRRKPSRR